MKRIIKPTKKAIIIGIVEFAVVTTLLVEVLAQVPDCGFPSLVPAKGGLNPPSILNAGCNVRSDFTYRESNGTIFSIQTSDLITIENVTIKPNDINSRSVSNGDFSIINFSNTGIVNIINNGNLISGGSSFFEHSVIYGNAAQQAFITNTGLISVYRDPTTNLPDDHSKFASAISMANSSGLTLDNQAGGEIYGGSQGVFFYTPQANATLNITNAGVIDAQGSFGSGITVLTDNPLGANNAITNADGATIKGTRNGISIEPYTTTAGVSLSNLTITNRGSIIGTSEHGIYLGDQFTGATITNHGTISGGMSAIYLGGGGHTINIHPGAVFTNGIDFNSKTGNILNFHTGSYTLGVKNYLTASNTINALVAGTQAITSGLNGAGTGNIVVADAQAATTTATTTNAVAASVANIVSSVSSIAPPVQGVTPEVPPPGGESAGFGQDFTAFSPLSSEPEKTPLATQTYSFANLKEFSATDLLKNKSGQRVDSKGNLAWGRVFGSYRSLPNDGRVIGNSTAMGGVMFGYDRNLEDWRLGAYAGYSYGYTRMNDASGKVSSDYFLGGVYARRKFGEYTLLANLSGGVMSNKLTRSINLGAEEAKASFNGFFIAPELALSRDFAVAQNLTLTPTLRARYVGTFLPSYRESGSSQNIAYSASSAHGIEERAELKLTYMTKGATGLSSAYYVQAAAIGTHRVGDDNLTASLLGTNFVVNNPHKRNTAGASVGVGFDHQFTQQTSAFGGVDASYYTDKTVSVIGRAGVKVTF